MHPATVWEPVQVTQGLLYTSISGPVRQAWPHDHTGSDSLPYTDCNRILIPTCRTFNAPDIELVLHRDEVSLQDKMTSFLDRKMISERNSFNFLSNNVMSIIYASYIIDSPIIPCIPYNDMSEKLITYWWGVERKYYHEINWKQDSNCLHVRKHVLNNKMMSSKCLNCILKHFNICMSIIQKQ